jgi:3-hydroxyisobutyrate dehydrogenase
VDQAWGSRDTALEAADILAARGIGFLDAPVSGGVEGARNGRLSIMCGGDAATLEKVRAALDCYGARVALMGPTGAGQATKAVNQVMVAGINEAVCEALALGAKLGLDADALLPTLGSGAAANWFLEKRGATLLRGEFAPGFKCEHMLKDLRIARATAASVGIAHPVLAQAEADYAVLVREGHGQADTSALIALKLSGAS